MVDKAVISEYTWRSKEMQKVTYPDMPHFFLPDDLSFLMRQTQRKSADTFHCMSLAVLAETENDFKEFVKSAWKIGAIIKSDLGHVIKKGTKTADCVSAWKASRREGAAKAGGDAKAKNAFLKFWDGFGKIKDRWHLSDNSAVLMKEAGIKHHDTVRVNLGYTRWEWRKLSDAKRERVLKQLEKEVKECLQSQ